MEITAHVIEIALLAFVAWKAHHAKQPILREMVRQALTEHVRDGGGRERLRASVARLHAKREQRRAERQA